MSLLPGAGGDVRRRSGDAGQADPRHLVRCRGAGRPADLYELFNEGSDNSNPRATFGLFNWDGSAKPVATAIHNMTTILHDPGVSPAAPLGSLSYTLSNAPANTHSMVIEKSDGHMDLVVWAEPQMWNNVSHTPVATSTTNVSVSLGATYSQVQVFDPLAGANAQASYSNASSLTVGVSDHPVIIELSPAGAAAPTASQVGTPGPDTLAGAEAGNNYLRGGDGADQITGGRGFNNINGNMGDDTIVGRSSVGDWLLGGQGSDLIDASASSAHNILNGNLGADTLHGGAGGDTLRGGQGDDLIVGGSGADWISGDLGHDTLTGGGGADVFRATAGLEVVTDFNPAQGDRVQIEPGAQFTVSEINGDVHIDLSSGGQMILQNAQLPALPPDWLFTG